MERKIARWESKGKKYSVDLFFNPEFKLANGNIVVDAHYRGEDCSGGVPATSEQEAIAWMENRVLTGYFQADKNKTPMQRVL